MTLNSVIALILRFFLLNSIALLANYVTVVEDRPIMSVKYCLPVAVFPLLAITDPHALQRGFSAIAELLVILNIIALLTGTRRWRS